MFAFVENTTINLNKLFMENIKEKIQNILNEYETAFRDDDGKWFEGYNSNPKLIEDLLNLFKTLNKCTEVKE